MLSILLTVPIGIVFLGSSLICTPIQVLMSLLVFPVSPTAYRVLNAYLMGSFWSTFVWLIEWWGRCELRVYGDPKDLAYFGKESALCMSNHRSDVDWAIGWVFAQRSGCIGGTRALIKEVVQYVPVVGWSMWFSEYLFLARNFSKDHSKIKDGYERLRHVPFHFWVALFVEGTRFTPAKLKAAQAFAQTEGLPIPQHTLVPRTKGFVVSMESLRTFAPPPAIYDFTVNVPTFNGLAPPTFKGILTRRPSMIDVHLRRVPISEVPSDADGAAKWCREAFIRKDAILEEYIRNNGFDEAHRLPTSKSPATILHMAFWTACVVLICAWLVAPYLSSFALTWSSLAYLLLALLALLLAMRTLIFFTQSEHSTPMRAPAAKPAAPAKKAE